MLGLPDEVIACLFDLDGVLTDTAAAHAQAWKDTFEQLLRRRRESGGGGELGEFDLEADYDSYVDGKPRADGVRDFLASRGIELPEGEPDDPPDAETVHGVGNRKNELLLARIRSEGVKVFDGSLRYLEAVRAAGKRTAVVSSSENTEEVVNLTGLASLLEVRVDALVAAEAGLDGKPAPDTYLEAARRLGVEPGEAAIFEDALAGVEAGKAGHFAVVVGVDRVGQRDALAAHGATVVVGDLAELIGR